MFTAFYLVAIPTIIGYLVNVDLSRYLLEHGLKSDGRLDPEAVDEVGQSGSFETFFTETSSGKYVPRSIFVDLDPSVRSMDWKEGRHMSDSLTAN